MTKFKKINNEVFYTEKLVTEINGNDLTFLKKNVKNTQKNRIRICTHLNEEESLQEMFIVLSKESYIRPHKHINKAESMIVLQGDVDYVTFDSRGKIEEVISMSDVNSAKPFYQSIRSEIFHTLLIRSEWLVFLEITEGPFNKGDTIFAEWSPEDINLKEVAHFVENLNLSIRN